MLRMDCTVSGRRRRPAPAAAGLGGLDRQRLGRLRGRPRRHRRAEQGRRRGAARARGPPGLDHRPGAGRLAALPAGRGRAGPADLHRVTAVLRRHGVHHRRHRADGPRRGGPRARSSAAPTAPRASGSRCSAARCCRSESPATLTVHRRGRASRPGPRCRTSPSPAPDDRHFRIDAFAGEVQFGPAVRAADGALRHYGAVPPPGRTLRLDVVPHRRRRARQRRARPGAGAEDQRPVRRPGREPRTRPSAGREAETLGDAKVRGPMLLRSRGRAVTAEDFVQLARDVAPEAARVHCVAEVGEGGGVRRAGRCRTWPSDEVGRIRARTWTRRAATLERISDSLDERRLVGTRLLVAATGVRRADRGGHVQRAAALRRRRGARRGAAGAVPAARPADGGPDGTGWPFGRSVQSHEVHAALARIPGVDMAQEVNGDPVPGRRRHRARGPRRCSGSTCPTTRWSSPTSTRCGSADERNRPRAAEPAATGRDPARPAPGRPVRRAPVRQLRRGARAGAVEPRRVPRLPRPGAPRPRTWWSGWPSGWG